MKNKNILKYKNLDDKYFSTGCEFTYIFKYEGKTYIIDWDWDNKQGYFFFEDGQNNNQKVLYRTIYEALDGIKFNGKTLRKLLLETDFDFYSIS